jgi:hypothetical protein
MFETGGVWDAPSQHMQELSKMRTIPFGSQRYTRALLCVTALWGGAALGALTGCGEKAAEQAPQTIEQERERHQEMSKRESGAQN